MIHINLIDSGSSRRLSEATEVGIGVGVAVLSVGLGLFLHAGLSNDYSEALELKRAKEITLSAIAEKSKRANELIEKEALLEERIKSINLVKTKKQLPVRLVDELTKIIPDRCWLKSLKQNGGVIELEGIAVDNQTVSEFMLKLDQSDYFGTTNLVFSQQQVVQGVELKQFALSVEVTDPASSKKDLENKTANSNKEEKQLVSLK